MARRRTPKPHAMDNSEELSNSSRNERQKAVLLCEVNRVRRLQLADAVEKGKQIVETSKKLCEGKVEEKRKKTG